MKRTILVTGGTGFIGGSFINYSKDYHKCVNLGRNKNNQCKNIYWNLKDSLEDIREDIDTVVHCASLVGNNELNKSSYIDINVKSTLHLLEFCERNQVRKFIYISTGGVYGYKSESSYESDKANPIDMYSMSKYFSEKICELYSNKFSIVILRLFFPYGNGQKGRLFDNLIKNISSNKDIILNKGGYPVINPIHISDVNTIINQIIEINCSGIFNLCGEELISVEDLSRKIAKHLNVKELKCIYTENNISNLIGSNKNILNMLKYRLQVDLDTGISMYLKNIEH
jgi:UDP-glucose 4-epimerase